MRNSNAIKLVLLACSLLVTTSPWVFAQSSKAEVETPHNQAGFDNTQALNVSGPDGPWKDEFDRICAQTEVATSLSKDQLEKLVIEAGVLIGQLREVEDPWAKVYIFRLEKCREFFEYALQWKAMEMHGES